MTRKSSSMSALHLKNAMLLYEIVCFKFTGGEGNAAIWSKPIKKNVFRVL